jgi:hypothetical protein
MQYDQTIGLVCTAGREGPHETVNPPNGNFETIPANDRSHRGGEAKGEETVNDRPMKIVTSGKCIARLRSDRLDGLG